MNSEIKGEILLSHTIPDLVGSSYQIVADYNTWYDSSYVALSIIQKKVGDDVIDPLINRIDFYHKNSK
ncbi:MAG: hypothetical protein L3J09_02910 [Flavobacteriaceae bacterium]|nr:hypothetical protein [Flavobacteriaceae bacterium]